MSEDIGESTTIRAPGGQGRPDRMQSMWHDGGMQSLVRAVVALVVVVGLTACTVVAQPSPRLSPSNGQTVDIGVGPELESVLLAATMAELLMAAGMNPKLHEFHDSSAVRQALEVGDVDVAVGYTGQAWLEELGRENPPGDPRTSLQRVRTADEPNGIVWLRPEFDLEAGVLGPPADATFALFVTPETAQQAGTIAELATLLGELDEAVICVDPDFGERSDGWTALASRYSISERVLTEATPAEAIAGVASGECLVGLATATDGQAWAAGLVALDDTLEVFPSFVVSLQVREAAIDRVPGLLDALQPLASHLTTAMLGGWNARVIAGEPIDKVAADAAETLLATPEED